jgi:membrane-associated phospholipid phosphatase
VAYGRSRRRRAATALAVIGASYLGVRTSRAARFDAAATAMLARGRGTWIDRAVSAFTDLGSVYGAGGLSAALALRGHRREAVDVAGATAIAWVAAQAAKPALRRPRPYEAADAHRLVAVPAGSSWPSGHAAVAAAAADVLGDRLDPPGRLALAGVVATVGVSRLYVGVHHLTDVVAGVGVGMLSAEGWRRIAARPSVAERFGAVEREGLGHAER